MTGYEKAIAAVGTPTELARRISEAAGKRISLQAVLKWGGDGKQIPVERCQIVEQVTGIPRAVLRPDIFGNEPDTAAA